MIYLFFEPDDYLLGQSLSKLKQAIGDPEIVDINLTTLDGSRISAADLLYHTGMMPFLAERRLVVVRGYLKSLEARLGTAKTPNKAAQAEAVQILEGLADLPQSNDLVLIEEKLDKRRALWKGIDGVAGVQQLSQDVAHFAIKELTTPDIRQLPGWIARTTKQKGIPIEGNAIQMLATFVGPDLRQLNNELEKLRTYAAGRPITAQDIRLLVSDASEALIWDLTDAMSQRDGRKAMRALYELRRNDANPFYLLTMITRQYRIMIKVKDAMNHRPSNAYDIASRISENPFPVRKAMAQSRNYPIEKMEAIVDRLLTSDYAMKTGSDPDTELDILVAELTNTRGGE